MTHMGFVTMVLLAPATIEDQKLTMNEFSAEGNPRSSQQIWWLRLWARGDQGGRKLGHTVMFPEELLALVVDCEPDCPCRQVS